MGGLIVFLAAGVVDAIKRRAVVYALMGLGGILAMCAAGYVLRAAHEWLLVRYGEIDASLIITSGLLVAAIMSVVAARIISRRPVRSAPLLDRAASYRLSGQPSPRRLKAVSSGVAGAIFSAIAAAIVVRVRNK